MYQHAQKNILVLVSLDVASVSGTLFLTETNSYMSQYYHHIYIPQSHLFCYLPSPFFISTSYPQTNFIDRNTTRSNLTSMCSRGHWRPSEDQKLRQLVQQYGPHNWNAIAEKLQGRSGLYIFVHRIIQWYIYIENYYSFSVFRYNFIVTNGLLTQQVQSLHPQINKQLAVCKVHIENQYSFSVFVGRYF